MYQVIPNNVSEILLKRTLIFIFILLVAMVTLYFYQGGIHVGYSSENTGSTIVDLNKTGIAFTSLDFQ